MPDTRKTKVTRAPGDISTKVLVTSISQLVLAIVIALVTGDVNAPEITAAATAVLTAVLGYFTADRVEV